MKHVTAGLSRPCNAWDLILITGGLQCGNCLATDLPEVDPSEWCTETTSDMKPCPLRRDSAADTLCWAHRAMRS